MSAVIVSRIELSLARLAERAVVPGSRHVGVDAVDIARFSRQLDVGGRKLAERWFTEEELAFANGDRDRLAATLAGKEAVAKVLGTGIRGAVRWKTIEIPRRAEGAPFVRLHAGARDRAHELGVDDIAVSLCHEGMTALAVASGCMARGAR
jgi:holo-[acyl-carrier protein] synthase